MSWLRGHINFLRGIIQYYDSTVIRSPDVRTVPVENYCTFLTHKIKYVSHQTMTSIICVDRDAAIGWDCWCLW